MKFVDVTERTTQGARSGKKKLKDTSERTLSHSYSSSTSSSSSSSSMPALTNAVLRRKQQQQQQQEELLPFPTFNFSIPPESVAQVFFFRHYSITGSIRHYEMQKNSAMSALKMMGIVAVGMAGLAISKQDPGVMALARRKYGSTLLSINEAIKTREEVAKESTVAAVTLMARFEACLCLSTMLGLDSSPKLTHDVFLRLLLVRRVPRKRLGSVIYKVLPPCCAIGPRTTGTGSRIHKLHEPFFTFFS